MPIVQIKMWEGRTQDQKDCIINSVAAAVMESMGVKREHITILLEESPKSNWGTHGAPAHLDIED